MLTIAFIDENIITRLGLLIIINGHFKKPEIIEADNLIHFMQLGLNENPDLIIMKNYRRIKSDILNDIRQLKALLPDTQLIVYDERENFKITSSYFQIGVSGHLLRQNIGNEIIDCIKTVLNGKYYVYQDLSKTVLNSLKANITSKVLTTRETEIAELLSQGKTTCGIAKYLLLKPSTVSTIKHNIFKKLQVDNVIEFSKAFEKMTQATC